MSSSQVSLYARIVQLRRSFDALFILLHGTMSERGERSPDEVYRLLYQEWEDMGEALRQWRGTHGCGADEKRRHFDALMQQTPRGLIEWDGDSGNDVMKKEQALLSCVTDSGSRESVSPPVKPQTRCAGDGVARAGVDGKASTSLDRLVVNNESGKYVGSSFGTARYTPQNSTPQPRRREGVERDTNQDLPNGTSPHAPSLVLTSSPTPMTVARWKEKRTSETMDRHAGMARSAARDAPFSVIPRHSYWVNVWPCLGVAGGTTRPAHILVYAHYRYMEDITEKASRMLGCMPAPAHLYDPMGRKVTILNQLTPNGHYLLFPRGATYREAAVPSALLRDLVDAATAPHMTHRPLHYIDMMH